MKRTSSPGTGWRSFGYALFRVRTTTGCTTNRNQVIPWTNKRNELTWNFFVKFLGNVYPNVIFLNLAKSC